MIVLDASKRLAIMEASRHQDSGASIMRVFVRLACIFLLCCSAGGDVRVFPAETWQEATPESQGIDPAGLRDALDYLHANSSGVGTDETAIVRNGYLVWQGPGAENVHEIYSCTKTFTSTVLGLLVTDGTLGVDDRAVKYLPSLDDRYPQYTDITLRHLATMTSGYDGALGDGWRFYRTDRARHHEHVLAFVTPGPPLFAAGTSFKYHDPAVHLLGYILTRVTGKPLAETFKQRVADPIGMKHFAWSDYGDRDGVLFNNPAGTPGIDQGGIHSNALDLARYGLLYLNDGRWNGRQILDANFVAVATSTQVSADVQTRYLDLTGRYGFFWWTNGVKADGTRPWPAAPPRTFAAHGGGRNFIFVVPEWNLVIVRLSPAPGGHIHLGSTKSGVWKTFFARLRPAIQN